LQAGSQLETEVSMGGRPRIHAPGDQFELGYYRLNLSDTQLDDVSNKLRLVLPQDRQFKEGLKTDGVLAPADGQELVITYKGNYVRIKYQQGRPVRITPEDKPKDKPKGKPKGKSKG
jgi:hypothetical protein